MGKEEITYYYRGESEKYDEIIPSILRGNHKVDLIIESEYYSYSSKSMEEVLKTVITNDDEINVKTLGLLQHYGFKTRLIDITKNKDVATYFASSNKFDEVGYVYSLTNEEIIEIKNDDRVSVKRKIAFITKAKELNNIDIIEYFSKEEKVKTSISPKTIKDAVILDYSTIFTNKQLENLRLNKQNGCFILLGNDIDSKNILTGTINYKFLDNKIKSDPINFSSKLNNLYDLSEKGINHVNLFPDSDISIDLVAKYNEIFKLNRLGELENFVKDKFSYDKLDINDNKYKVFVDFILNNLESLKQELSNNSNYFYLIFKEIVDYYNYYYNIDKEQKVKDNNKIIYKNKENEFVLYNLEVTKEIVKRAKHIA